MTTTNLTKTSNILAVGDEVIHDGKLWTVETVTLLEQAPNALYDLKLHRVPGRQDDALSEEWVDVTASEEELWVVTISPNATGLTIVTLFANLDPASGGYGDIYTDQQQCLEEHPGQKVLLGYGVLDVTTGLLADDAEDFCHTVEDAREFLEASNS